MSKSTLRIAAFLVVCAFTGVIKATPPMRPGLWEIIIRPEAADATPLTSLQVCLSKDAIERFHAPKQKASDDCKATGGGFNGNVLSYSVKCASKKAGSTTTITFSPDSYEGLVVIQTESGEVRHVHAGKRLRDCDEPAAGSRP